MILLHFSKPSNPLAMPSTSALPSALTAVLSLPALCLFLLSLPSASALDNGLARTPQMGWNSWNYFHCNISEVVIRGTASAMVSSGLHRHGYSFVNIDDCWADHRDAFNRTVPDMTAFPSGMFALASAIHALGLQFGVYSDSGTKTCAGRPGSLGYEAIDALTYAAWQVDYLKVHHTHTAHTHTTLHPAPSLSPFSPHLVSPSLAQYDDCYANGIPEPPRYAAMRDALNATGRPILFSICAGNSNASAWAPPLGNSWRTTTDINVGWPSIMANLLQNDPLWPTAAPGAWNDPDMLEVGNGLSHNESVTHFSLWCLVKAPLILGNDLRAMSQDALAVLTNDEVIALNQDPLGMQGHQVWTQEGVDVWAGVMQDGSVAVVMVNRNESRVADVVARWEDIGLKAGVKAVVRDLWLHAEVGVFDGSYGVKGLAPRQSVTVRVTPVEEGERKEVVRRGLRARDAEREAVKKRQRGVRR